jgi:hypothetical protein
LLSIFLSHYSGARDVPLVTALLSALPQYGIEPFVAERHRQPGRLVTDKIREALDTSEIVVVLFTKDGHASAAVNQEVGYATKAGKFVIPLVEKGVTPTLFAFGMDAIEYDPANPLPALMECVNVLNAIHAKKQEELRRVIDAQKKHDDLMAFLAILALVALAIGLIITLARSKGEGVGPTLPAPS